ncbi:MAG: glycogen debranching protein GlgX [Spirochaetes bacterium]|nr:glycogen debranching protein GlgX [Spirochaetota bacterium]
MSSRNYTVRPGAPRPFGATPLPDGVNFCVFSRNAGAITLCFFSASNDAKPCFEFRFDPHQNRTGDVWHCFVEGASPGTLYGYRADGPFIPARGHRFNPNLLLIDPYAKAVSGDFIWDLTRACGCDSADPLKDLSKAEFDDAAFVPKSIVVGNGFDWRGDRPLNYPLRHCILYEAHVRGFTRHPSSGVEHPGTYRGIIESIPRLKELGITSLELLPVQEFDEFENTRINPKTGKSLTQYWGYSTIAFFAPKGMYSSAGALGGQVTEFKEMVRELHAAGIEIILDVVFNHTGEGSELGPTLSFRGFDNAIWYMLGDDPRYYKNYSGCGNTLNCNHPVVRNFIMDCLHYWVVDMHVDGFRFDLGSILGRDQKGRLLENPPVIEQIAEDPLLRHTKIIAEAWDAGGAYQVGWFPGGRWAEWNDRFRDDVRRFWRGDAYALRNFCTRLAGSSDLYLRDGRKPFHSINYLTSHDGFTLNDLVSYNGKHNEDNGEHNDDGHDSNFSYNYGHEGPISDPKIEMIRERQVKNFLATLLLSIGTPMLLAGDEFRRTQGGNNNAYCQNNETSWLDWSCAQRNEGVHRFSRRLTAFRLAHPAFRRPEFFTGGDASFNALPDVAWFAPDGTTPDWARLEQTIGMRIDGSKADIIADRDDNDFFIIFNASTEPVRFAICPPPDHARWCRVVDTNLPSPRDIVERGEEEILMHQDSFIAAPFSLVVLLSMQP